MSFTAPLGKIIRKTPLGSLLDTWPSKTLFYDGVFREISRSTHRLLQLWNHVSRGEAEAAFDLYDGGDFLDVGAFHGFFSFCLAPKANPGDSFISIEPDGQAFPQLLKNLAEATTLFTAIKFFCIPFAASNGTPVLAVSTGECFHPSFRPSSIVDEGNSSVTIDELVSEFNINPKLIKIDVEGAEYYVLQGAKKTLNYHRPNLILEIHPTFLPSNNSVKQVQDFLQNLGYKMQIINEDKLSIRTIFRYS